MAHMLQYCVRMILLVGLLATAPITAQKTWNDVTDILQAQIDAKIFPGCVAAVVDEGGFLYLQEVGNYTYGDATPLSPSGRPMSVDTRFDLASLTKVIATTTAAMTFFQRGQLDLDMKLSDPSLLGSEFANHGKEVITIRNLLVHNSGFPPDPSPNYWSPDFPCSATRLPHPPEVFDCREIIYKSLMTQTLDNVPGTTMVYSDLNMITLMFALGTLAKSHNLIEPADLRPDCSAGPTTGLSQCYYEAYVRKYLVEYAQMSMSGFLPPQETWESSAPTENDTSYQRKQIQGQVSDGNAYALGGIAGHAGFFSTALDISRVLYRLMFPDVLKSSNWISAAVVKQWTKVQNVTQSSRALGWDTNDYTMNTYRGCGNMSASTYTHTGYTGTEACNDPERKLISILLTNRVYPDDSARTKTLIQSARQAYHNAVRVVFDQMTLPEKQERRQQYPQL